MAATGGYIGDTPPYQGHVVTIEPANGQIIGVWNSLCSDRHELIQPSTCDASDSAIWGRPRRGRSRRPAIILVATGNAPSTGRRTGATASSSSRRREAAAEALDALQRGAAERRGPRPRLDRAGAARRRLLRPGRQGRDPAPPAALEARRAEHHDRRRAADGARPRADRPVLGPRSGRAPGYSSRRRRNGRLDARTGSSRRRGRTVGGRARSSRGLLYVQWSGDIHVYAPENGAAVGDLPIGDAHWQSPIVVDGRVVAAEGDCEPAPDERGAEHLPVGYARGVSAIVLPHELYWSRL